MSCSTLCSLHVSEDFHHLLIYTQPWNHFSLLLPASLLRSLQPGEVQERLHVHSTLLLLYANIRKGVDHFVGQHIRYVWELPVNHMFLLWAGMYFDSFLSQWDRMFRTPRDRSYQRQCLGNILCYIHVSLNMGIFNHINSHGLLQVDGGTVFLSPYYSPNLVEVHLQRKHDLCTGITLLRLTLWAW